MFHNLIQVKPNKIQFTIKDVELAYINAVRRIILSEIPNVAFYFDSYDTERKDINIIKNTGVLHNEFLAHRLSLLPLCFDETEVLNFDSENYKFVLHKKNTSTNVLLVTSNDIEIYKKDGTKYDQAFRNKIFPPDPFTKDYVLITKLKPNLYDIQNGEEIHIEAFASKDIAKKHARWSPVSQCSYFNAIDDELAAKTLAEKLEELKKNKSPTDKEIELVKNKFNTLDIFRCYKKNKYDDPNEFIFTIESECRLTPKYLFTQALQILVDKLHAFSINLQENTTDDPLVKIVSIGNVDNLFQVEIKKEDHTLLNTLQAGIYAKEFRARLDGAIDYIGYTQPHPLDQLMYLKIKFKPDAKANVKEFLIESVQKIVKDIEDLKTAFEKL